MHRRIISTIAVTGLLLTACGGGSDDDAVDAEASNESELTVDETESSESGDTAVDTTTAETSSGSDATDDTDGEGASGAGLVEDLPQFLSDFDRVCSTETGFGGATPYAPGEPGPHPFVLMEESDSGYIFDKNLRDAPAGWNIQTDMDFEDNSEIVPTELIGCALRTATNPTGIMCDLEMDDGSVVTLELVDVTYELTVREATTGNAVGTDTIEATDTDCPSFVFIDEGDTQYFNAPDSVQYINAMKPYVTP